MKTTIDLPDALLVEAKKRAAECRTTLRVLFERGLRRELAVPQEKPEEGSRKQPRVRWVTSPGGLPPGLDIADRVAMHDWLKRKR